MAIMVTQDWLHYWSCYDDTFLFKHPKKIRRNKYNIKYSSNMKKLTKNTSIEAHHCTKSVKVMLLFIFFSVFFISTIFAFEFDNVKTFNETDRSLVVHNAFNLPLIGDDIAKINPLTPHEFKVIRGKNRTVAEFKIENYADNYLNVFKEMEFYNLKNNNASEDRQFFFQYESVIGTEEKAIYERVCENKKSGNGTNYQDCSNVFLRNDIVNIKEWRNLDTSDPLLKGTYKIRIVTDVKTNEKIEFIPTWFGVRMPEYSVWTESLNTDLVAYYKFDEQDTTGTGSILNEVGTNATNAGADNSTGKINTAYDYIDTNNDRMDADFTQDFSEFTFSGWVSNEAPASMENFAGIFDVANATQTNLIFCRRQGTTDDIQCEVVGETFFTFNRDTLANTALKNIVFVWNSTGISLWVNGTLQGFQTSANGRTIQMTKLEFGRHQENDGFNWDGILDEIGIWNRSLSETEIIQIYNEGTGISFTDQFAPTVTLNSPIDAFNSTNQTIDFNGTIVSESPTNISNVSLIINDTYVETNSSGINNSNYFFTSTLPDGNHNWTYESCNTDNQCVNATVRTLNIDSLFPTLNVTFPRGVIDFHEINTNLSLNWTVNDTNLDTCFFDWNGTNNTVTCLDNQTNFNITDRENTNLTFWANDTFGQLSFSQTNWSYKIFQNSLTFNSSTIGGSTESFILNITKDSSLQISVVDLVYNLSASSASFTAGDTSIVTRSIDIPNPSADANLSFFFSFTMSDSSIINTTSNNQTVLNFGVGNCSIFSTLIYNFTMLDEENQTELDNVTIDYSFTVFDSSRSTLITNVSFASIVNPTAVCINQNLTATSLFSLDAILKYDSSDGDYLTRYYNILNRSLTNDSIPNLINIYAVLAAIATPFQLTFRDESLALSPDILVNVNKQFVSSGDFKTVEIPITDTNGQTILNLVRNIGIYNLIFTDVSGAIVASFNKVTAFCQDFTIGECTLNLDTPSTTAQTFNLSESIGISFVLEYTNSTNIATLTFSSLNSTAITARIVGTTQNQFGNQSVCDSSLTSTLGTVECNASSILETDNFLFIDVFSNGEFVETRVININPETPLVGGLYGSNGYFIAFLMMLFIIILFSEDRQVLLIMLGMGWVVILVFGLVKGAIIGSVSGGIWLLVTIVIMLWKLKKEEIGR